MTPLARDRIDLWLVFYDEIDDPSLLASYRALTSDAERARELRFHRAQDRLQYLITRVLVRTVLSRYLAASPADWRFTAGAHGKPAVDNEDGRQAGIRFNLAHTYGLIALAVSKDRELGVDVENLVRRQISLEIAERYFAPDEVAALAALPSEQRMERFFEYWTLKESYIKARGMGLSIPLDRFSFDLKQDGKVQIRMDAILADDPARWHFWHSRPDAGYALAVCAERLEVSPPHLSIQRLDPCLLHA
jgi:4'-phosphopantetheinyl transferase